MRQRAEKVLPAVVLAGFLTATIAVTLLLGNARERGIDALEESVLAEVEMLAAGMSQRFQGQLQGSSGALVGFDLEAELGSERDQQTMAELDALLGPLLEAGLYVVTLDGVVTAGILIPDDAIGERVELDGLADAIAGGSFSAGYGQFLPVGAGLGTDQPVQPLVIPVLEGPGQAIGAVVLEGPVNPENALNGEVRALRRGETGRFFLADDHGTVLAATDPGAVAAPLPEPVAGRSPGVHRVDGTLVVVASMDGLGWTVAITQDVEEFQGSLAGPLQEVGVVLVMVLLTGGFVMTVLLIRRLRSAREEQARLAAIGEAQQELISIVSHELRTPVAGVLGFLETSLDHWDAMDDDQRRSAVARAAANARRLQAMARDVLDTQHLETGRLVVAPGLVDLVGEVRDAVAAHRELDADRRIDLEVPDEAVWVTADADRIQQVLTNLLDNARKSSPAAAPIAVSVRAEGDEVEVAVHDEGPGVSAEARQRIFDKFVRARSESVTGTGLGLYISRQIVEAHGGHISVDGGGEGATFRFVLPRSADAGPAGDAARAGDAHTS